MSDKFGYITSTPKLAWQNTPLLKMLVDGIEEERKSQNFRVAFDTDCNILARHELENGGHGIDDGLAYITVGTGIGVGVIINGKEIHGLIHPEAGHIAVPRLP
mmetsp:Transcript_10584/g.17771  ORF Transcript_10584/g.17771 Transcript_10584/m.17771 type:complete len:103 (+) Transcript_10584:369-677(+)